MATKRPSLPLFKTEDYKDALGALQFGVQEKKLTVLFGEPGSEKTTILRNYLSINREAHYILCSPNMTMKDLLVAIGDAIGIHVHGDSYAVQRQITLALLDDPRHCLLFDECEYLHRGNVSKIDVIRQIFDEVQDVPMVLCGTYKLKTLLAGLDDHSQPQIFRRLLKAELGIIKKEEFLEYLNLLERQYAVVFQPDARTELFTLCLDRENGGLGVFFALVELLFSIVRPEWKEISLQREAPCSPKASSDSSSVDLATGNMNGTSEVNVATLSPVVIDKSTIRDASRYKMTK